MQSLILLFHWGLCPDNSKPIIDELQIPLHLVSIREIQSNYCENYNLQNISVVPDFSPFTDLDLQSHKFKLWQAQGRTLAYQYGVGFYQTQMQVKMNDPTFHVARSIMQDKTHSLHGFVINNKKMVCTNYSEDSNITLCDHCKLDKVDLAATIIIVDSDDPAIEQFLTALTFEDESEDENDQNELGQPQKFDYFGNSIYLYKNNIFVVYNKKSKVSKLELKQTLVWVFTLIKGIKRFGNSILEKSMYQLPPFTEYNSDQIGSIVSNYIGKFLFRFVYTHPEFLSSTIDSYSSLRPEELKMLTILYEYYTSVDFWMASEENKRHFVPPNPIPFLNLYKQLRLLPIPTMMAWVKQINPQTYYSLVANPWDTYQMSPERAELCYLMAKYIVENNATKDAINIVKDSQNFALTKTKMTTTLYGKARGGFTKNTLPKILNDLVDNKILIADTSGKYTLYYLNPQMPYTVYFIELTKQGINFKDYLEDLSM